MPSPLSRSVTVILSSPPRSYNHPHCASNAVHSMLLYIMNKISGMQASIQLIRARDKAKQMTHPHDFPLLPSHVLDGLIHLLERFEMAPNPQPHHSNHHKAELKFYARTAYLALAIRCGDSIASSAMVASIESSSYYLAHKFCLNSSDFAQFLGSGELVGEGSYFDSQQHQQFEECLSLLLGAEGKVSTPFDFAYIMSGHLSTSSYLGLLDYLIEFALTVPETAQLSSEEIFVGCCLVVAEKANSHSLSGFLVEYFEGAFVKGGQLMMLIKQLFESINSST